MLPLRSVRIELPDTPPTGYPFSLPFVQAQAALTFTTSVTFLVGENGSGKSTYLEALACAARMIVAGSGDVDSDKTLAPVRPLAERLALTWNKRTRKGFFLRAEDFFGYVKRLAQTRASLAEDVREIEPRSVAVRTMRAGWRLGQRAASCAPSTSVTAGIPLALRLRAA